MPHYAGIGSTKTPQHVCGFMADVAEELARQGWTVRTGAAEGADSAFEEGARRADQPHFTVPTVELYLPWHRYNGRSVARLNSPEDDAFEHAARYHPAWEQLDPKVRCLHARNSHIILGPALRRPVKFVVCWTPNAAVTGGTGQGLRVAAAYGIPVFNLARDEHMDRLGKLLGNKYASPRLFS